PMASPPMASPPVPIAGGPGHAAHAHPSLDGTAPPSTMQTAAAPRRSGAGWVGALRALFGLVALGYVFVVPRLAADRTSAREAAGDTDEDEEEDTKDARKRRKRDRAAADDAAPDGETADDRDSAATATPRPIAPTTSRPAD